MNSNYTKIWQTFRNKSKKHYVLKIGLTFHCLNKLFYPSQIFCTFCAFSLEFQNVFSIRQTFFLTASQNNLGNKIPIMDGKCLVILRGHQMITNHRVIFRIRRLSFHMWCFPPIVVILQKWKFLTFLFSIFSMNYLTVYPIYELDEFYW